MNDTKHTGWQNGLCQDYCRKMHLWFATRLDARAVVRRFWGATGSNASVQGR